GDYNAHYRKAAETLAKFRPQEKQLNVRTGWEFNGDWMAWSAQKDPVAFAEAFRQFVNSFRAVSPRFRFEWNVNIGGTTLNPEMAYPGDRHVDLIGMDFYWQLKWDPADPLRAWENAVTRPYGLRWHQAFAKSHGKPTTYSEWGISADNATPYLTAARDWFAAHPVVFHTYWDSNADYPGRLSDGQYPQSGASFRSLFGSPVIKTAKR
ncbi:MAG: glycosyl hydrolase, partial [Armatimonadota bacterium]